MKFEDLAREAGRALSASGRSAAVPPVAELWARRRRRGLVLGLASIAIVAVGTVATVATLGDTGAADRITGSVTEPGVSVPTATIPGEDDGVPFFLPRVDGAGSIEYRITLLDGTELSLTLPQSLADDIQGFVHGGAASWRLDPCCGRTLDVIYGSVADVYGERQPDVEYEDADGNPVGFYTEDDDVDYLVFQYGSWVVRAWDGDAEGQRFSEENREMFASLMRGAETAEGFLVLDPVEPMSIGPTDSPDATLTTLTGEGVVGVFKWRDCSSEGPSTSPDLVTSAGALVSFAESSGMTSICFPESSLYMWVSRLDLTETELESIDLTYTPDQPDEVSSITTTTTTSTTTTVSTTTPGQTTTSALQATGPWSVVPDHPVVGRVFPVVVWTGNEVVVWGGEKPSEGAWHADGAAFNPTIGTWRDLAESPLSPRSQHVAVWTGEEVIVCCGRIQGGGASSAAYDPLSDEWREIEAPPIRPSFAEAVWTGDEMLVFGGVSGGGTANLVGATAYDPTTDSWRRLADLPYGLERTADATMGDGVVYAWPSSSQGSRPNPLEYDIAADEWSSLPDPPAPSPSSPSVVWTGDLLFAYGAGPGSAVGIAMVYDPTDHTWRVAQRSPLDPVSPSEGTDASQKAAWADGEVYIWTGWVGTDWDEPITRVVAYDPSVDSWRELEPAPVQAQGLWHEPIIWTGSQLITYSDPMLVFTP